MKRAGESAHVKSIIFDVDGTLVDSQESILEGLRQALNLQGIKPTIPLDKEIVGPPLIETLIKISGFADEVKVGELVESFVAHYDSIGFKKSVAYDGINQLLIDLKRNGVRLYVATNKRHVPTAKILEHFNWTSCFKAMYAIDSQPHGRFQSKSETIANLVLDYRIDPKCAVYIGDRLEDFEAAQSNGIKTILVGWGYGARSDLESCGAPIVHSAQELKVVLLGY